MEPVTPRLRRQRSTTRLSTSRRANVKNFTGPYAFLADYEYNLGADQLTVFGQQEMIDSGVKYYNRYN